MTPEVAHATPIFLQIPFNLDAHAEFVAYRLSPVDVGIGVFVSEALEHGNLRVEMSMKKDRGEVNRASVPKNLPGSNDALKSLREKRQPSAAKAELTWPWFGTTEVVR